MAPLPEKFPAAAGETVRLRSRSRTKNLTPAAAPGSAPGIESIGDLDIPPAPGAVHISCFDYGPNLVRYHEPEDIDSFLAASREPGAIVRWINIDGLHPYVVNRLRGHYGIHTLAAEDVLRTRQRPKVEDFDNHLFIVMRMLMLHDSRIVQEQVSLFLFPDTLITFQETIGDVWEPVRQRIRKPASRLCTLDTAYLLYALLDALVDHCFPILEQQGQLLDALEEKVLNRPSPGLQRRIQCVKRDLAEMRRVIWPTREVINFLQRADTDEIPANVKTYMRDVYDHTVQVMDVVETYREMAQGLHDLYMSAVSNRMNEIMKVLTIMASYFIPITFVAGVYGMNFECMPELHWPYSYAAFWVVILGIVSGMTVFFVRGGWIGGNRDGSDDT